jgi:solute carrier family 35, member C2
MFSGDVISFPFPIFMTSLHQAVQFALASLFLYLIPSLRPQRFTLPPSSALPGVDPQTGMSMTRFYIIHLIPTGVATALDMGLGNMSLQFSSLTFITACKSSVLVFILLFAFLFGLERPSARLVLIIAVMTVGEVMMALGEVTFSVAGFTLVTSSAFFSGFRWALSQLLILKHPATSNPISMLFHLSPVVFVTLVSLSLSLEDPAEILEASYALSDACGAKTAIALLLLPGCLAFCMVLSQFALLQRSSVVTLSVCGILKEVVIIGVAGMVFGDELTPINICGVFAILASVVAYNYMKISAARNAAKERYINEKYS